MRKASRWIGGNGGWNTSNRPLLHRVGGAGGSRGGDVPLLCL
ncbi:hypothetical protein ACJIZ3_009358 [Penstemon smallii]|uniref:Uncharacterized protein n=1 Tax=Penstemon smallii TaxID=265156 RepID=A0ABD3TE95_9LAMI